MPIAKSNQGRVQTRERPIVQDDVRVGLEDFGGGQGAAQVTQQAVGISRDVANFADRQIADANNLAITNFDNRLAEKRLEIEKRELVTKGLNAIGSTERADEEFRGFASELSEDAQNDVQRDALTAIIEKRSLQIQQSTDRHTITEIERQKDREYKARELTMLDSAATHWNDDDRLFDDWFDYIETQDNEVKRQGMSEDEQKAFILAKSSEFHSVVLNKMIEEEDTVAAEGYLDFVKENTPGLTQDALQSIEAAIEESNFRGDAQDATDKILARSNDWKERFDLANNIKDPKKRDEVRRRLKDERNLQKSLEAEAKDEVYTMALNAIEANPRMPLSKTIPSNIWSKLSLSERNGLMRHKASFDPATDKMDWQAFENFYNTDKKKLAKMSLTEVRAKFISKLDRSRQSQAINRWTSAKDAARDGKLRVGGRSDNQIIMNRLRKSKYITPFGEINKALDQPKLDLIMPGIEAGIEAFKNTPENKGVAPSEFQINEIVDDLLIEQFRSTTAPGAASLQSFGEAQIKETGALPAVKFKQMSSSDLEQILTKIRKVRPNFKFNEDNEEGRLLVRRVAAAIRLNNEQLASDLISGRIK